MFQGIRLIAVLFAALLSAGASHAATPDIKRVALVIGNSAYEHSVPLPNPKNDAALIAETLRLADFKVISGSDLDKSAMLELIDTFTEESYDAEVALVFYAGHGMQVNGQNYLIPVDAELQKAAQLQTRTIPIDKLLAALPPAPAISILILDACRDNPLARSLTAAVPATRSLGLGKGLASVQASGVTGGGLLIAYATDPGAVAYDGKDSHSPYTSALSRHLTTPGVEIQSALTRVRAEVSQLTGGAQRPWHNASLSSEVFLGREVKTRGEPTTEGNGGQKSDFEWTVQQKLWDEVSKRDTIPHYELYLKSYPDGSFASLAKLNIDTLQARQTIELAGIATINPTTASKERSASDPSAQPEALTDPAAISKTARASQPEQLADQAIATAEETGSGQQEKTLEKLASVEQPLVAPQAQTQTGSSLASEMLLPLDKTKRIDLQKRLTQLGFDTGSADGNLGARSRNAIGAWQSANAFTATNYLDGEQLALIIKQSDPLMQAIRAVPEVQKKSTVRNKVNRKRPTREVRRKPSTTQPAVTSSEKLKRSSGKDPAIAKNVRRNTVQSSFGDRGGGGGGTKE